MGDNYMDKKVKRESKLFNLGIECGKQQMLDYIVCVLRNPTYVGKDIFGRERIDMVLVGLGDYEEKYDKAYTKDVEADVAQDHLDDELRECFKDDLVPFKERQPSIIQLNYNKARKGWVD